ncbi:class I SAM-dependent methyltransferase [candidate division KSB1 bacterium]
MSYHFMENDWFKNWFGEDYLQVYSHRNANESEVFINTLTGLIALKPGSSILDLCCGAGRYSILLAKKDFKVTGVDLSEVLIRSAKKKAADLKADVNFEVKDMRSIIYESEFDLIINMFTSFGYFESEAENEKVIRSVYRSLKTGSYFVLDYLNCAQIVTNLQPYDEYKHNNILIQQYRKINRNNNRVEKTIKLIENEKEKTFFESVRLYNPDDLKRMFKQNGFEIKYELGNYLGEEYCEESPRYILIGRKPDA